MINYTFLSNGSVEVRFDQSARVVGRIKQEKGGWRYWVAGASAKNAKGDLMDSREQVMRSLEEEE